LNRYEYWYIRPLSQNLVINSAILFDWNNWFLAGYSPEFIFAKSGGGSLSFKKSFIFDPNSNFTILVDDPVLTNIWDSTNTIFSLFSSSNMGYGSGITRTSLTITPVNSSPTIAASSCSPPADMLVPDMTLYLSNL